MSRKKQTGLLPSMAISQRIYFLHGFRVMLDADLAELHGVTTSQFNQAIRRNLKRFPRDFMFQLTKRDAGILRSQIVISKNSHEGRRFFPYAFTEHGVAMLSSVLRSDRAVQVNIAIMRLRASPVGARHA